MSELPLNDRLAGPFIATAGQTDFPADFPLIDGEGLRVRIARTGVDDIILSGAAVSAQAITGSGFTARLATPALAGDVVTVFSRLPARRNRAHVLNGAIRTATLEDDATSFQAQLQEHRRDIDALGDGGGGGGPSGPIAIEDVTGLTTALSGKAATSHTHTIASVSGLQTALDAKANADAVATALGQKADATATATALAGKAPVSHGHAIAEVIGLQSALDTLTAGLAAKRFKGAKTFYPKDYGAALNGSTDDAAAWALLVADLDADSDTLNVIAWDGASRIGSPITITNRNVEFDGGIARFTGATGGFVINQTDSRIGSERFTGVTERTEFQTTRDHLHTALRIVNRPLPYSTRPTVSIRGRFAAEDADQSNQAFLNHVWITHGQVMEIGGAYANGLNANFPDYLVESAAIRLDGFVVAVILEPRYIGYVKNAITGAPAPVTMLEINGGATTPTNIPVAASVTGGASGKTGVVIRNEIAGNLWLLDGSGDFSIGETITAEGGQTTGPVTAFSEFALIDTLTGGAPAGETFTGASSGCVLQAVGYQVTDAGTSGRVATRRTTNAKPITNEIFSGGGKSFRWTRGGLRPYGSEGWYIKSGEVLAANLGVVIDCEFPAKLFTTLQIELDHANCKKGAVDVRGATSVSVEGTNCYPLTSAIDYIGLRFRDCIDIQIDNPNFKAGQSSQLLISFEGHCVRPAVFGGTSDGPSYLGIRRSVNTIGGIFIGNDFSSCDLERADFGSLYPGANHAYYFANPGIPDTYRARRTDTLTASATPTLSAEVAQYNFTPGGATNLTDFLGVTDGHDFEILFGNALTTIVNSATMLLRDGANFTPPAGTLMRFLKRANVWIETNRHVPGGEGPADPAYVTVNNLTSTVALQAGKDSYNLNPGAAQSYSGFSGGFPGRVFYLRGGSLNNATLVHDNANCVLRNGVNVALTSGRVVIMKYFGSVPEEIGRNF